MTLDKSRSSLGLGFFICRKGFQVPILGPEGKLEARHNLKEDQHQKTEPKNPAAQQSLALFSDSVSQQWRRKPPSLLTQDHLESMGIEPLPSPRPTTPFC